MNDVARLCRVGIVAISPRERFGIDCIAAAPSPSIREHRSRVRAPPVRGCKELDQGWKRSSEALDNWPTSGLRDTNDTNRETHDTRALLSSATMGSEGKSMPHPPADSPPRRTAPKPSNPSILDAAEDGHSLMQTVLDNMGEGVALFDRDFRLRFINRQCMEFQGYPSDVAYPGASGYDMIRFQIERGDFGPGTDVERTLGKRVSLTRAPDGYR